MISERNNLIIKHIKSVGQNWWGMIILSAIPVFLLLSPVLIGSKVFGGGDATDIIYPAATFYSQALKNQGSIFLNPYILSGMPSFISIGFFSPLHYLFFRFLSFTAAYHYLIFLYAVSAVFFTALLLKKIGASFWGSYLGGLIYLFSQWDRVSDIGVIPGLSFLPLFFLLVWQLKKAKIWPVIVGSLAIGLMWLTVNYNWAPIILAGTFAFAIFLAWCEPSGGGQKWLRIPGKFLIMVAIGTLICLIQLLPLFIYLPFSARASGLSYHQSAVNALGLLDIVKYILPYFKPPFFASTEGLLYVGALPLFFLLISFTFKDKFIRFFSFLFFGGIVIAIAYSPVFWLMQRLPVFNYLRVPSRWLLISSFAAAILVGLVVDKFLELETTKIQKNLLKIFGWLLALLTLVSLIVTLIYSFFTNQILSLAFKYFDQNIYPKTTLLPLEHYHQVIKNLFFESSSLFNLFDFHFFLPFAFLLISYLILRLFFIGKIKKTYFLPIVVLITLINFLSVFAFYHPVFAKAKMLKEPRTASFIKKDPALVFSLMPGFTEFSKLITPYQPNHADNFVFKSEILSPNLNILYQIKSIDGYDSLMPNNLARLLALIGSDRAPVSEKLAEADISLEEKIKKFEERKKILDFLGVKYVISAFDLDQEKFIKVFQTAVPPYNIPISIYENKEAKPLVYFANKTEFIANTNSLTSQELIDFFNKNSTFIECGVCPRVEDLDSQSSLEIIKDNNTEFLIKTKAEKPQLLVLSKNYLPGWKAFINNKEMPIYQVGTVYMGIVVPAGQNEVKFNYSYFNYFD